MNFLEKFQELKSRILCSIILDKMAFPFKNFDISTKRVLATFALFIIFLVVFISSLLLAKQPITKYLLFSTVSAVVSSLSIFIVDFAYRYGGKQLENTVKPSTFGQNAEKRLIGWVNQVGNIKVQIFVSLSSSVIVLASLKIIQLTVGLPFYATNATFFTLGIITLCVAQGGYWAIVTPLITHEMSKCEVSQIEIYKLNPSNTVLLRVLTRICTVFLGMNATVITLCLVGFFALSPSLTLGGMLYVFSLILIGYIVSLYTFLYPQYCLAQIIQRAKANTMFEIQSEINKLTNQMQNLNPDDFSRLKGLTEIHDNVHRTPNSTINLANFQSFFGSILIPTLIAIIGVVDWKNILPQLPIK